MPFAKELALDATGGVGIGAPDNSRDGVKGLGLGGVVPGAESSLLRPQLLDDRLEFRRPLAARRRCFLFRREQRFDVRPSLAVGCLVVLPVLRDEAAGARVLLHPPEGVDHAPVRPFLGEHGKLPDERQEDEQGEGGGEEGSHGVWRGLSRVRALGQTFYQNSTGQVGPSRQAASRRGADVRGSDPARIMTQSPVHRTPVTP